MDKSRIKRKAKTINLKSDTDREFFLIHGYTGSTTDFSNLAEILHKKFNATVKIPLLRGHGRKVDDLSGIKTKDFINQIESEIKRDLSKGKKIIIGGYSFGAQIAVYIASKYNVRGIFLISIPYKLKFPFNAPFIGLLGVFKKKWKKKLDEEEIKLRKDVFYYEEMHANGLKIVKKANKLIKKRLCKINAPILFIHSKNDQIGSYKCLAHLNKKINSDVKEILILEKPNHNPFFSNDKENIISHIEKFIKKNDLFKRYEKEKVTAIVPSYNEGSRISSVLNVLRKTRIIDEIIVVDDGSNDNTQEVVSKFKDVVYLRNNKNMGKGYSMERGVNKSKNTIIFFCDADVINLTPSIVESTIEPVMRGDVDMFIAMRGNFMQRTIKLFGLNSGERALRKKIWQSLPDYYKYRYRIEAGLNYYVNNYARGLGYKIFNHSQPIKEKKYGLIRGTFLRWWMNLDVLVAYISCIFMDYMIKNNKNWKNKI